MIRAFLFLIFWPFISIPKHLQVQTLYPLPCPGSFSEKCEARINGRIMRKATDGNALPKFVPAIKFHQLSYHIGQSDPVKWVVGLILQDL